MEPTDLTLEVLRGIQQTLVEIRGDLGELQRHASTSNDRLASLDIHAIATNERLASLARHAVATRESIDLLRTQAVMAGQALTAQMEVRLRLDERVDGLERRIDALESDRR